MIEMHLNTVRFMSSSLEELHPSIPAVVSLNTDFGGNTKKMLPAKKLAIVVSKTKQMKNMCNKIMKIAPILGEGREPPVNSGKQKKQTKSATSIVAQVCRSSAAPGGFDYRAYLGCLSPRLLS